MDEAINEKTIGLVETILVLTIVGVEEIFEVIILLITLGTGILITEFMNGAMAALLEMYMVLRGGRGVMKLIVTPICALIDAATGGLAPGKLIGAAIGIWVINHPSKLEKMAEKITKGSSRGVAAPIV